MAAGLLALLVAFALSPLWVDTARHLASEPWKGPVLVVPFLLWCLVRRESTRWAGSSMERRTLQRVGLVCIGLAISFELLAVGAGLPRWGRPALGLAVMGWLLASGLAGPATAGLAIFLVPIPSALSRATSPALENGWGSLASAILPGVQRDAFPFHLQHGDGGWAVAWLGAGLGTFAALRAGGGAKSVFVALAVGVVAGFSCQALAVSVAGAFALSFGSSAGRAVLTVAPSLLLVASAGLVLRRFSDRTAPGSSP